MKNKITVLLLLAMVLFSNQAWCESRSVFIILEGIQNEISVAIESDEEKENKQNISIEETCEIIKNIEGWGSQVNIIVISERTVQIKKINKIFETIDENVWTQLVYFENGKHFRNLINHLLKEKNL